VHGVNGDGLCEAAPDESEGKCGEGEKLHFKVRDGREWFG